MFDFSTGFLRYYVRVTTYAGFLHDEYPPFHFRPL